MNQSTTNAEKWTALLVLFAGVVYLSACSGRDVSKTSTQFHNVSPFGYSQYVTTKLGDTKIITLSGQVSVDNEGNTIGPGDLGRQTEEIFQTIKRIVEHENGTMADVVKLNYYVTDMSQIVTIRQIRDKYINLQNPPASTAVQVSRLFKEDIVIEIEATAIVAD